MSLTPNRTFRHTFAAACVADVITWLLPEASALREAFLFLFYASLFALGALIGRAGGRLLSVLARAWPFWVLHIGTTVAVLLLSDPKELQLDDPGKVGDAVLGVLIVSPLILILFLVLASFGFLCGRILRGESSPVNAGF